ncbi:hypothetical protein [Flavobacterium antarcticum]|uniref:hypothetical protein n=1 Tax=Flavobacterium antarcticum TaxID=271155 RepID=UPI0012FA9746|nr:hypothetical protein [Flavobacterium antarcticum]
MKKYLTKINITNLILMSLFLLNNCKTIDLPHKQGTVNDAIFNCIYDFRSINKALMKKDTVFAVISEEEDDFFRITIVGSNNKYLYNSNLIPSDNKMRNNYYETDNKLFIWYDVTKEIDEKTVEIYDRGSGKIIGSIEN